MRVKRVRARCAFTCEFAVRSPGVTMPVRREEAELIQLLTLQSWDELAQKLNSGSAEELEAYTADPKGMIMN